MTNSRQRNPWTFVIRHSPYAIRVPVTRLKSLTERAQERILSERARGTFASLADWTGMVETELFAPTYRSYGLTTVRCPVLEVEATVEPFENGRGFSLRVHRAGKPRTKIRGSS